MKRCPMPVLLFMFVVPIAIAVAASSPPVSAEPIDRSFDSAGVRIRYVEKGEGEPVVLIHGFSRSVELSWLETGLLDKIAEDHRAIALDCRGHGRSDKPHETGSYGQHMVEDIVRLLDHLDLDQAQVVGYSMGGRIALRLAASHPERVKSVALLGAGGARPNDDHALWDNLARALETGRGIRPLIHHIWPTDQGTPSETIVDDLNAQTLAANDAEALAQVAQQYREFATTEDEIDAIDVPVLAIVGSNDAFRPSVERLKKLKPTVEVREVEGANHLDLLSRPELREALIPFRE